MLSIQQADVEHDVDRVRQVIWEYLQWVVDRLREEYGIDQGMEVVHELAMHDLATFAPPHGSMLLAMDGGQIAGMAGMRRLDEHAGEIKRMYVREAHRRQGIGRALLRQLLERARHTGYSQIRLDSPRFMKEAHSLYRSEGFCEIGPYPGTEIPQQFHEHWLFMEKTL